MDTGLVPHLVLCEPCIRIFFSYFTFFLLLGLFAFQPVTAFLDDFPQALLGLPNGRQQTIQTAAGGAVGSWEPKQTMACYSTVVTAH